MTSADIRTRWVEVDQRHNDGITVSLLWNRHSDRLRLVVTDDRAAANFTIHVSSAQARDAFHHPSAYAA